MRHVIALLTFLAWMVTGIPSVAFANDSAILVLHSYHQEYPWTKGENDGFVLALAKDASLKLPSFSTEYLDTKRRPLTDEYQEFFFRYLRDKYQDFLPSLIFCSDDNALQFLMRYKAALFPNVPVVFCGINNLALQQTLDPSQYVGVYEKKEIAPNIAFITKVRPQSKTIYFVGDGSSTDAAIKIEVEKEMARLFPQLRYKFFAGKHLTPLIAELQKLQDGAIFLTTIGGFYDERQNLIPLPKVIDALRAAAKLPIISMEDVYVRKGVLGGYVTSGRAQGEAAAALAARIIIG